jgi:hypothetical protein
LDYLPKALARRRPPNPSDHGDRMYVPNRPLQPGEFRTELNHKALIGVTIWEFSNLTPGQSAFAARVTSIAPALFSVPLVTNIVITGLIIWRIKQAQDSTKFTSNHRMYAFYRRVIRDTIESCVLYPIFLLAALILYCLKNNGQDIVSPIWGRESPRLLVPWTHRLRPFHSSPARWPKSYPSSQR